MEGIDTKPKKVESSIQVAHIALEALETKFRLGNWAIGTVQKLYYIEKMIPGGARKNHPLAIAIKNVLETVKVDKGEFGQDEEDKEALEEFENYLEAKHIRRDIPF